LSLLSGFFYSRAPEAGMNQHEIIWTAAEQQKQPFSK
jgi:hypothetical protein